MCVVGGGLGGLALAIGLEKQGLTWCLCEAADELRCVWGQGLTCSGRAHTHSLPPARADAALLLTPHRTATGTLIGVGGNGLYALQAICPSILDKIK